MKRLAASCFGRDKAQWIPTWTTPTNMHKNGGFCSSVNLYGFRSAHSSTYTCISGPDLKHSGSQGFCRVYPIWSPGISLI